MLPLWRSKLTIALSAEKITLVKYSCGWRRIAQSPVDYPVQSAAGKYDWQSAIAALAIALAENGPMSAEASVVVGDAYARYALIPWPEGMTAESDLKRYSQVYFEDLFGDDFSMWEIKTDWRAYRQSGMAAALQKEFAGELRGLLAKHGIRVVSLQPNLAFAFNRWRKNHRQHEALLAFVDADQWLLAAIEQHNWKSVRALRVNDHSEECLQQAIQRELMLQGLSSEVPVYVFRARADAPHEEGFCTSAGAVFPKNISSVPPDQPINVAASVS